MDSIPQFIAWKDINLTYLGCNENYAELINVPDPSHVIGKKDADLNWNEKRVNYLESKEGKVLNTKIP